MFLGLNSVLRFADIPADSILELFGKTFFEFCQDSGYDKILQVLGATPRDFLQVSESVHFIGYLPKRIPFHGDKISIILVIVHYLSYHFHFLFWVNNYSDRHVQSYFYTSRTWTRFTTISPHCIRECGHRPFDAPKQTVASSYTTTQSARDWSTSLSGLSRLVKKAICKTNVKIYRFNGPFIH